MEDHVFKAISAQLDLLNAKIDASRAEGSQRGSEQHIFNTRIEGDLKVLRHEVKNWQQRVTVVEEEIADLKEADGHLKRQTSEADMAVEAALGGAMAHVNKLDEGFKDIKDELVMQNERSRDRTGMQDQINHAVCSTLGINYASLTTGVARNETEALAKVHSAAPKANLKKVAMENRVAAFMAFLAFLTALAQLISKSLGK